MAFLTSSKSSCRIDQPFGQTAVDQTSIFGRRIQARLSARSSNTSKQIELHQLELTRDLGITALKPRGFVLIGAEESWTNQIREGFRLLNSTMIDIEVITYDELLRRGQRIIDLYKDQSISVA